MTVFSKCKCFRWSHLYRVKGLFTPKWQCHIGSQVREEGNGRSGQKCYIFSPIVYIMNTHAAFQTYSHSLCKAAACCISYKLFKLNNPIFCLFVEGCYNVRAPLQMTRPQRCPASRQCPTLALLRMHPKSWAIAARLYYCGILIGYWFGCAPGIKGDTNHAHICLFRQFKGGPASEMRRQDFSMTWELGLPLQLCLVYSSGRLRRWSARPIVCPSPDLPGGNWGGGNPTRSGLLNWTLKLMAPFPGAV